MFQSEQQLIPIGQLINKCAESLGIDARCEARVESNPEKKILFEKLAEYKFPTTTKADYSSYAIKTLSHLNELKQKEKVY